MPVGVDHAQYRASSQGQAGLLKPLMPVGVDHKIALYSGAEARGLLKPLMPVGVDHRRDGGSKSGLYPVETFDASRR